MRKWLAIVLLALPFGLLAGEKAWFQGSYAEAQAQAKKDAKPLYLKFYADW